MQTFTSTGTSYMDTTAVPETAYSYRVRATYSGGFSYWGPGTSAYVLYAPTSLSPTWAQQSANGQYVNTLTWAVGSPNYTAVQVRGR